MSTGFTIARCPHCRRKTPIMWGKCSYCWKPFFPTGVSTSYASAGFKKRFCRSPQDFEIAARDWMRSWGFGDAEVTVHGADGGIDVESSRALAQVKAHMVPVGRPDVQQLRGAAHGRRDAIFFSLMDYTPQAVTFANEAGVALFRFTGYDGTAEPMNPRATALLQKVARSRSQSQAGTNSGGRPNLTYAERKAVLDAVAQGRSIRAVLSEASKPDSALGNLRVARLLASVPGLGPEQQGQIRIEMGLGNRFTLKGLSKAKRSALVEHVRRATNTPDATSDGDPAAG